MCFGFVGLEACGPSSSATDRTHTPWEVEVLTTGQLGKSPMDYDLGP